MKVSFENPDKVNGLLTITVEEDDIKNDVEKELKDYRKKARVPGFRPGMVPMGLIKRQVGPSVRMDVVNKFVGDNLNKYIQDNKIQMLGSPLQSEKQEPVDIQQPAPYTFMFDIAVAPAFKAELSDKDTIVYYDIDVDDKLIDQQVQMFASRNGHYDTTVKEYDPDQRDMLKGDLRELGADGNALEGGIVLSGVSLMPQYISDEEQKNRFKGAKLGDIITFNPRKAYPDNDQEVKSLLQLGDVKDVAAHTGDFTFQVTEISRYVSAPVDQALFDSVYGKDAVKSEDEFRARIREGVTAQLAVDSDFRFLQDVRRYVEKKVGQLTFPDTLLKRIMVAANSKRQDAQEYVDKNYDASVKELEWSLIKDQLATAHGVKVDDADVRKAAKEAAAAQFAQYGMNNVPDEYLDNYANEMIKKRENVDSFVNRAIDVKLTAALKGVVKLDHKKVSLDEFNKLADAEA